MKKNKLIMYILLIIGIFNTPVNGDTMPPCDPSYVYDTCAATALTNFENGTYSYELTLLFITDYCWQSALSCARQE